MSVAKTPFDTSNSRSNSLIFSLFLATVATTAACTGSFDLGSNQDAPTWEEFQAKTYLEPWADGVYIVNGDESIADAKMLREFYDSLYGDSGALIVHQAGGVDAKWTAVQVQQLSYCISDNFGANKNAMIAAMDRATGDWEATADIDFIYDASQDGNCTPANNQVLFDVRPVSGAQYLARAFFPNDTRVNRNVLVDSSSFGNLGAITLPGILRHELGHVLGFRHEHTRPEAGTCFEDGNWRPLTDYDQLSVMHYPQCNGVSGRDLTLSPLDVAGIQALYGAAGGNPNPNPGPGTGTPQSGQASEFIGRGETHNYQPMDVMAGSTFSAQLSGSGDADLYVRFDQAPDRFSFDCRPYRANSNEICNLDVPAGVSTAHIMIDGYTDASYTIQVSWVSP